MRRAPLLRQLPTLGGPHWQGRQNLRPYAGRDDDLVAFFEEIEPGLRSARVKQALRGGIEDGCAVAENAEDVFDVMASLFT